MLKRRLTLLFPVLVMALLFTGGVIAQDGLPDALVDSSIVFVSDASGSNQIYLQALDGSDPVTLTNGEADKRDPQCSPDATTLYFTSDEAGGSDWDVYGLDIASGAVTSLVATPERDRLSFVLRDGSGLIVQIPVEGSQDLLTYTFADEALTPFAGGIIRDETNATCTADLLLCFYIDSQQGISRVMQITRETPDAAPMTAPLLGYDRPIANTALSHDGSLLAFALGSDDNQSWDILLYDVARGETTTLIDHPAYDGKPQWSPDDAYLLFETERNGTKDAYVIELATGDLFPVVTGDSDERTPAWCVPPGDSVPQVVCTVTAGSTSNLRSGPGTNFAVAGTLAGGESAGVIGQAVGAGGFVWWQLEGGAWVRSDVVSEDGDCESAPQVE